MYWGFFISIVPAAWMTSTEVPEHLASTVPLSPAMSHWSWRWVCKPKSFCGCCEGSTWAVMIKHGSSFLYSDKSKKHFFFILGTWFTWIYSLNTHSTAEIVLLVTVFPGAATEQSNLFPKIITAVFIHTLIGKTKIISRLSALIDMHDQWKYRGAPTRSHFYTRVIGRTERTRFSSHFSINLIICKEDWKSHTPTKMNAQ